MLCDLALSHTVPGQPPSAPSPTPEPGAWQAGGSSSPPCPCLGCGCGALGFSTWGSRAGGGDGAAALQVFLIISASISISDFVTCWKSFGNAPLSEHLGLCSLHPAERGCRDVFTSCSLFFLAGATSPCLVSLPCSVQAGQLWFPSVWTHRGDIRAPVLGPDLKFIKG